MNVTEHLKALESELLTNRTRNNAERVASLLADSFREYGSSGRVCSKGEILSTLQEQVAVSIFLSDFAMLPVSESVALVTYMSDVSGS